MRTILSKIKLLLVAIMLLVGMMAAFADDGSAVPPITLNVKAGTLRSLIPESKKYKITSLKLTGELNADDISFIRDMGARRTDNIGNRTDGHLQYLDISDVTFVYDASLFGQEYGDLRRCDKLFEDLKSLQTIILPRNLERIGQAMLADCDNLTSITLPSALRKMWDGSVSGCKKLASIKIDAGNPYYHSEDSVLFNKDKSEIVLATGIIKNYVVSNSVTRIRACAFYGCSGLTSLILPPSLTEIGNYAFDGCSGLTSLTLPSGLTEIGSYAFDGCSGLTSLVLPSSLTEIGSYAFDGCSGLTSLTLPSGLTEIESGAFRGCSGLTSLTLPSGLTEIGNYAFQYCSGLTSLTLPSGLTEIGYYAFYGCRGLTSLTLPSGLTEIGSSAFSGCSGLTSLTLPSGLTEIGKQAFSGCNSIKSIYAYMATPPTITQDVFEGTVRRNATLYVPVNSYQDYWLSTVWGDFANIKTFEPTPVEPVLTTDRVSETSRYTADGQRQANPVKGLNIVKMSDGTVRKIMVR